MTEKQPRIRQTHQFLFRLLTALGLHRSPRCRDSGRDRIPLQSLLVVLAWASSFVGVAHGAVTSATGRWGILLAHGLYICKDRESAWTWTNASEFPDDPAKGPKSAPRQTVISIISSNATVLRSWRPAGEFDSVGVTADCKVAWFIDIDRQKVLYVDRDSDTTVGMAPGTSLSEGVTNLYVAEDYRHAWVRFSSNRPVASLERTPQGLVATEIKDGPATAGESSFQTTYAGESVAIVPLKEGLILADRSRTWRVPSLAKVDVSNVYPGEAGRVLWISPQEKGLFLIDDEGKPIEHDGTANLLPREEVDAVLAGPNATNEALTTDYAWIKTTDRHLYLFRTFMAADGHHSVVPLNGGRPIAEPHGGPLLHVEEIKWEGDGSTGWVETTSASWSPNVTGIWRISAKSDGTVESVHLDPQLYESKPVRWLFSDYPRPDVIWVRTSDYVLYEIDYAHHTAIKDPFRVLGVTSILSSNRPDRLWLETATGVYLLGPAADLLSKTSIDFDGQIIGGKSDTLRGQLGTGPTTVAVQMPTIGPERPRLVTLSVRKEGFNRADDDVVASGSGDVDEHGLAKVEMFVRSKMTPLSLYDVDVTYGDQLFFDAKMTWSGIRLSLPWYEWPYAIALVLLLGPTVLLVLSLQQAPLVRRWVPIAVPAVEALAARTNSTLLQLTFQEVLVTAVIAFVVVFIAALFSPPLFRAIAAVHPYRALVPTVLQISAVRRRFFSSYLDDLASTLKRIRVSALDESYCPIPCRVLDSSENLSARHTTMKIDRLEELLAAKDASDRSNILIEAPGGRGKSALLNELLRRAVRRFEIDPQSPLPVLGAFTGKTLEETVSDGLGRFRVADDFVTGHLYAGDIALFVDGLSECGQEPLQIEAHFKTPGIGQRIRICATSRPAESWHKAFSLSDRWLVACPERLTDDTIADFVKGYAIGPESAAAQAHALQPRSSVAVGTAGKENTLERWRVARAADGTYLPLLVRFAMLASQDSVDSIADLYKATLGRLLDRASTAQEKDALRQSAQQLAVESYWRAGERVFEYDRSSAEETQHVQRLLDVGVLINADATSSRMRSHPSRVRFIHDSMQSYLVATALNTLHDWPALARAAGAPEFARAGSDLVAGSSSELFDMCVHVFRPVSQLRAWLRDALLQLARQHGPALSIDQIRRILTERDSAALRRIDPRNMTPLSYLTKLVEEALRPGDAGADLLGRLYGSLEPRVWGLETEDSRAADEEANCASGLIR